MEKTGVVASLGELQLLRPAWTKAALAANDRLKLYLTVLQAAQAHAEQPSNVPLNLKREFAAAQVDAQWLTDLPSLAYLEGDILHLAELPRLIEALRDDLRFMARPLDGDDDPAHQTLMARVAHWCDWFDRQHTDTLAPAQIKAITSGNRHGDDSFHVLIMDLHKALNHLSAEFSNEEIEGAHVWQLNPGDRPRISAFMRGLNRTRALKLNHPGLDTAATRDGDRLLIQNDIGTNDAHVIVVQVEGLRITLIYSDLHERRFAFFQAMLSDIGGIWSSTSTRSTAGLNADEAYCVGTATFDCKDDDKLLATLDAVGSRIVFLIDWNRARKQLNLFVGKSESVAILTEAARREVGHMGWLAAGAEQLIHGAMQALGTDHFRIGQRLDQVMGEAQAKEFLIEALALTSQSMRQRQPLPLVADAIRLLLLRYSRKHREEFDLLSEHAAFCQALAEGLRDAIAHGHERDAKAAAKFAERAKNWERQADLQVIKSRSLAENRPSWLPFVRLIERADDVADALEEAAFLLSLLAENHRREVWHHDVKEQLRKLADATLTATQDHIKALGIARCLSEESSAEDQQEFIATSWRVLNAEQQCDVLFREVRRALAKHVDDAATHALSTDFAAAIEAATDALLATTYGLRDLAFSRLGAKA
ncbi:MAG TPA: hypothetical protein VIQ29_10760 [Ancylobacter sp.]